MLFKQIPQQTVVIFIINHRNGLFSNQSNMKSTFIKNKHTKYSLKNQATAKVEMFTVKIDYT